MRDFLLWKMSGKYSLASRNVCIPFSEICDPFLLDAIHFSVGRVVVPRVLFDLPFQRQIEILLWCFCNYYKSFFLEDPSLKCCLILLLIIEQKFDSALISFCNSLSRGIEEHSNSQIRLANKPMSG